MQEKCQYCGCTNNVVGMQSGYASVVPNKALSLKSQPIYHIICLNCGTIIRSYVPRPQQLVVKKG